MRVSVLGNVEKLPAAAERTAVVKESATATLEALVATGRAKAFKLERGRGCVVGVADFPADLAERLPLARMTFDHRYFELVQRTLSEDFKVYYALVLDETDQVMAMQPMFFVRQNLMAGVQGRLRRASDRVQKRLPGFLTLKMLMVGNPAGPAALSVTKAADAGDGGALPLWVISALSETVLAWARRGKSRIVVFKDFPQESRGRLARLTRPTEIEQYGRMPSMPMTRLDLAPYQSFEHYLQTALSKSTRKNLRRKFRDAEENGADGLTMSVTSDLSSCIDELYPLYLQVYERAKLRFEKLTPDFFVELGRRMPDRARFFIWRTKAGDGKGRAVAFSATLLSGSGDALAPPSKKGAATALYDLYLGMEYPFALNVHLYFLTLRDVLNWTIEQGIQTYISTPLSYEAKLHFKHRLVPLDLYVRHVWGWANPAFKYAMRFAEPTRHDKILPQFPNFGDLTA